MTAMMLRSLTRGWETSLHWVQTPEMMFFCIFGLAGGLMEGANEELSSTADDEKIPSYAGTRPHRVAVYDG